MKGIKVLLQGIAVAAYTSGWWAVGVFDNACVEIIAAVLAVATILFIFLGACWLSAHWND